MKTQVINCIELIGQSFEKESRDERQRVRVKGKVISRERRLSEKGKGT